MMGSKKLTPGRNWFYVCWGKTLRNTTHHISQIKKTCDSHNLNQEFVYHNKWLQKNVVLEGLETTVRKMLLFLYLHI